MISSKLAERGLLPTAHSRFGIRRMLREHPHAVAAGGCETRSERHQAFLAEARDSDVELATELAHERHGEDPGAFFEPVLGPRMKTQPWALGWRHPEPPGSRSGSLLGDLARSPKEIV